MAVTQLQTVLNSGMFPLFLISTDIFPLQAQLQVLNLASALSVDIFKAVAHVTKEYQTLLAGILAIIAARITVKGALRAAHAPLTYQAEVTQEAQHRKLAYTITRMSADLRLLSAYAISNTNLLYKAVMETNMPIDTPEKRKQYMLTMLGEVHDWEIMSQIPPKLFQELIILRKHVFSYNYFIERDASLFDRWNTNSMRSSLSKEADIISAKATELAQSIAALHHSKS